MNSDFDRPERKGHGAQVPGSEMARERKGRERVGQGANRPESYWPISSGERKGSVPILLSVWRTNIDVKYFGRLHTLRKVKSLRESLHSMDVGLGLGLR